MTIEVLKPGLLTTLQDAGRPGYAHLGVGRAGAFDLPALRIANALCGNPTDTCGLEATLLGPTLRFHCAAWIALTGAGLSATINGMPAPVWTPLAVPANATLGFGAIRSGCRAYLAVRGGFKADPVLGSRSIDVNSGLGPMGGRPLRAGDTIVVGDTDTAVRSNRDWQVDPRPWFDDDTRQPLRLLPSRHLDNLTATSRKELFSKPFEVQQDSNRVGLRLAGPKLEWRAPIDMVSEGCVPGLLQLPPSGQPIAFGPECPVSGGYPRIGQITAVDLPRLAQRRPGDTVRFTPCTLDEASAKWRQREQALARLEGFIGARLRHTQD